MLVAGIMSGTSVDGIDVALVDIRGSGWDLDVKPLGFHAAPLPPDVRDEILAVCDAPVSAGRISQLSFLLGRMFGEAVLEACAACGVPCHEVELVGSHGQTVYHQGGVVQLCGRSVASTLQIGEPAWIARLVRAPVVADFRPADVAAGGHGAPLVPLTDYLMFRHARFGRVLVNIGGIANLTAIPAGAGPDAVLAFDTGPGNMVIDQLVQAASGGERRFDRGGRLAARGAVDRRLLERLLDDPYYSRPPPKSTGRESFGAGFVAPLLAEGLRLEDLVATAAQLTVRTILSGVERFVTRRMRIGEIVVSGGGRRNPSLLEPLREGLPGLRFRTSDQLGIDGDAKEAIAFAILAYRTWRGRHGNLPSATGASGSAVLGKITPAPG